ncbi:hypothetical protein [Marinobacter sp.]|uniref:hypothetical protein n=1 Tax=Marinobacter sp. TaxID=50741 RepID=UPI002B48D045|nr:hypothetical protein [Marinobacter sp.]HKK56102.1 hypothetical protein [Marinobacter sp.]
MSGADWLSYSLQDFIMFGPQVLLRLFVRINQDFWPWPLLAVLASFSVPLLLLDNRHATRRIALGLIAAAWMTSGYGFLVGYFGPINWPAAGFGWAFVAQGGLLGLIALAATPRSLQVRNRVLAVVWALAVVGLPWLTVAESGNWRALALFGLAPGSTAAASMLIVGLLPGIWRWLYLALPLAWCLFSAATFWVLQTWWLLGLPVATLILVGLGFWLSPSRAQSPG